MKTLIIVVLAVALAVCTTGINPFKGTMAGLEADYNSVKSQIIDSTGVTKK
jgi:hypothetical protein